MCGGGGPLQAIVWTDEAIDQLLDRSQLAATQEEEAAAAARGNDILAGFKVGHEEGAGRAVQLQRRGMDAAEEPGGRALISRHPISHRLLLHEAFRGVVHSLWAACGSRLQVAHFELREAPPEQPPGSGAAGGTPAPGGSADTAAAAGGAGTGAPDAAGQFSALAFWEQLLAGRHAAAQAASAAALGKGKRQRRKLLDLRADAALDALLRGASSSDGSSEGGGGRSGRSGRSSNASGASAGPGLGGRLLDPRPALLPFLMRFRWSTRWSTRAVPWLSRSEGCTVPSPYPDACLVCGHTCPPPPPPLCRRGVRGRF